MLHPAISDEIIEDVQRRFQIELDDERREVLRCTQSQDVRACPGSGKTTLLCAKLACLTSIWPHPRRGIAVMSHTNVARHEIENRFAASPGMRMYRRYPHFIGTIQAFLDRFLAVPAAIMKFGCRPCTVTDDGYIAEARRRLTDLCKADVGFRKAVFFLEKRVKNNPEYENALDYLAGSIWYQDAGFGLPDLGAGEHTLTYQQIAAFKQSMSESGFFGYRDMFALSAWYAARFPEVTKLIAARFPLVFIDEMQDTSEAYATLLDVVLSQCVVQRFGDDRQAIYGASADTTGCLFPREHHLSMAKSYRLSRSVAGLVQHVCAGAVEQIDGNPLREDLAHTIFLFDQSSVGNVVPAFGHLVAEQLKTVPPPYDVRVVGAYTKPKDRFPACIGDYCPTFTRVPHTRANEELDGLADYLMAAQQSLIARNSAADCRDVLLRAAVKIQALASDLPTPNRLTPKAALDAAKAVDLGAAPRLLDACGRTAVGLLNGEVDATQLAEAILSAMGSECRVDQGDDLARFVTKPTTAADPGNGSISDNLVQVETDLGPVVIQVGTIHGIKGETVRAVLVLETFAYKHDLGELVKQGVLAGAPPKKPGKRLIQVLKQAYVAMSRPTDLLCMAIAKERVPDAAVAQLLDFGWRIQVLGE